MTSTLLSVGEEEASHHIMRTVSHEVHMEGITNVSCHAQHQFASSVNLPGQNSPAKPLLNF